jgi:hypothetical protein
MTFSTPLRLVYVYMTPNDRLSKAKNNISTNNKLSYIRILQVIYPISDSNSTIKQGTKGLHRHHYTTGMNNMTGQCSEGAIITD